MHSFNHYTSVQVNCDRLLAVRGCRPGKTVQMTEAEVRSLCLKSREIFLSQPILLELEAPLKICGWYSITLLCSVNLVPKLNCRSMVAMFSSYSL